MTRNKMQVGILFGGKSAEHEVSLQSAKNVADAIDKDKYDVVPIGIDKSGRWLLPDRSQFLLNTTNPKLIKLNDEQNEQVTLVPQRGGELTNLTSGGNFSVDVVFPILHGPFGEDGTVQGVLKLAGVPFVGASVLGSAVGMDKDIAKRLLRDANIPIAEFLVFQLGDSPNFEATVAELGLPFFVKPANLGSSVGVNKVTDEESFRQAIREAYAYDSKILIEEFVDGRELECAVLGNENPIASVVGEVVATHDFYSYEAKYIDENGAALEIPAELDEATSNQIQKLAIQTFRTLSCDGLARVDFFLRKNGELIVNEINTMPGFTKISMYPQLWRASGISYPELINRLIELAIARFDREQALKNSI